ncbi:MAG: hypothetical protein NVS2B12_01760 [Ktedonobacteraceae bacterium]
MRITLKRSIPCSILLLALLAASCAGPDTSTQPKHTSNATAPITLPASQQTLQANVGQLSPTIDKVAQQVLDNISQHGWNMKAQTHGQVTGGLFINWKMDDPNQTNALKAGDNEVTAGNHDPQVDLLYLNALAEYATLHSADHKYDADIQKATAQVQLDFANYSVPKGWIYFTLLRDGLLLKNTTLMNDARTAASNFYDHWYDPEVGIVFNRAHIPGNVNVEHALNCGAALVDAGARWNQPGWIQAGKSTIDHMLGFAIDPHYHLFYNSIVVTADKQLQIQNYQAKPSTQGNGAEALINAYNILYEQHYLDVAGQILRSMFASSLWDTDHQGLLFALVMNTGTVEQSYKETRSQTLSLIALYHYNQALQQLKQPPQLLDKEQQLIDVIANHFYQATYHGYFYRMTPAYQVYVSSPGKGIGVEDYFTTEAMGTALDSLQQTEFAHIQL